MRKVGLLLVFVPFFFTACTHFTMDENQCKSANWYEIGVSDASQGHAPDYIAEHAKACKEHNIGVNHALYKKGWNVGVRQYCTPEVGYREGIRGHGYHGLCPSDLVNGFYAQFSEGRRIYDVRAEYRRLEEKHDDLIDEIAEIKEKIVTEKSEYTRNHMRDDIRDKEKEKEKVARKMRVYELKHANDLAE